MNYSPSGHWCLHKFCYSNFHPPGGQRRSGFSGGEFHSFTLPPSKRMIAWQPRMRRRHIAWGERSGEPTSRQRNPRSASVHQIGRAARWNSSVALPRPKLRDSFSVSAGQPRVRRLCLDRLDGACGPGACAALVPRVAPPQAICCRCSAALLPTNAVSKLFSIVRIGTTRERVDLRGRSGSTRLRFVLVYAFSSLTNPLRRCPLGG